MMVNLVATRQSRYLRFNIILGYQAFLGVRKCQTWIALKREAVNGIIHEEASQNIAGSSAEMEQNCSMSSI